MRNTSPTTVAIDSINQCLANAATAARGLDHAASQDLCSLLHLCACEAERVRKAMRKAAPKKAAAKSDKRTAKRAAEAKAAPRQARSRKAAANGAVAH